MTAITSTHHTALTAEIRRLRARVARLERAERQRIQRIAPSAPCEEATPTAEDAAHYRRVLLWDYPAPGFEG